MLARRGKSQCCQSLRLERVCNVAQNISSVGCMRRMKLACQLFICCVLTSSLLAQEEVRVTGAKVTEVGIYRARVLTSQTNAAGVTLQGIDDFRLLRSTTNVPARIGVRFGFRYEILGTPTNAPITLTMVAKHPPIKNAQSGKMETQDTYPLNSWLGKTYTSNTLDEPSDLVPGQWTFEVWHQGAKLCEQSFQVVADEDKPTSGKGETAR